MLEVARFLADLPPFGGLAPEAVEEVAASVTTESFAGGAAILEQGGASSTFVYVIREGSVEVVDGGRVVDVLESGDLFGFPSLLSGLPPVFGVRALEPTVCHLIDGESARSVFAQPTGMRFLTLSLRDRYRSSLLDPALSTLTAGEVAAGALVTVAGGDRVIDVARWLTEAGATAAVVLEGEEIGIVTDRDMRARVVAGGLSGETPVRHVATIPARSLPADASVDQALISMLSLGVHHLPIVAEGEVRAMLTDLDLLGQHRRDAFRLRSDIERADDVAAVVEAGRRIPAAVVPLVQTGVDADHVGVVMSTLIDALVVRLLGLAEEAIGRAPGRYAWLALGSGGRREQALLTDQDHALVYADADGESDEQYRRLAQFVVDGLAASGIPRCESKVMASEEGWRGSVSWWHQRIADWMTVPETKAAFLTGLAFDARIVTGTLELEGLFDEAVRQAASSPSFLNRLSRMVVDMNIPIGFLGNLVVSADGEQGTLDVKQGGLLPITEMARIHALTAGAREVGTRRRLSVAARAGVIAKDLAEALTEAHAVLRDSRLRHQVGRFGQGLVPDDLLNPSSLSPIERRSLRDAFRVVRHAQKDLEEKLRPRVLGR